MPAFAARGRPRMTEDLKEAGLPLGHRRVGRRLRENGIPVERTRKFKVEEDQRMIRKIIFPTTHGQRSHLQHRAEPAKARLPCGWAKAAQIRDNSTAGGASRNGAFTLFVRPTPQSDPWHHDRARIV